MDEGPVRLPRLPAMPRLTCDHFAMRGAGVVDGKAQYVCSTCGARLDAKRRPLATGAPSEGG